MLFPVAGLEMRAEHTQVDQRELASHQARQQRRKAFAADRLQGLVERGENRRFHQFEGHRGRHFEDLPFMGQVVAAVVVVRIDTDLLLAAEHQHRRAGDDQRPQGQQFFALQRIDRVIGLDRRQDHKGVVLGVVQQGRAGHRQVGNAPGPDQVAEVDHALQLPVSLRITAPDHIVVGDIEVNGLYRQFFHQRLQATPGLGGGFANDRLLLRVPDHRQQVIDQHAGVPGIPLQGALQARVLEVRQGQVHFAAQPAQADHQVATQVLEVGQRLAFDVFEQAHVHRLPAEFEGQQVLAVVRGNHPRHPQAVATRQVRQPRVLGLQFDGGVIAVADFQNEPACRAVDPIVEVLLAAQRLQRASESVMLLEQLQRLRWRDIRAWQTGAADQRGEQHVTTP